MGKGAAVRIVTGSVKYKTYPHPELREGEVCLGNIEKNVFYKVYRKWSSKRMGEVPYDIHGNEISHRYVPIFVQQAEVERRKRNADRYGSRKRRKKKSEKRKDSKKSNNKGG